MGNIIAGVNGVAKQVKKPKIEKITTNKHKLVRRNAIRVDRSLKELHLDSPHIQNKGVGSHLRLNG